MPIKLGDLTLFDVIELSKKFAINKTTARNYLRTGRLRGRKIGKKWYITEEALRDYFKEPGKKSAKSKV
jgi:predicted site-specific integrase-resolvase